MISLPGRRGFGVDSWAHLHGVFGAPRCGLISSYSPEFWGKSIMVIFPVYTFILSLDNRKEESKCKRKVKNSNSEDNTSYAEAEAPVLGLPDAKI